MLSDIITYENLEPHIFSSNEKPGFLEEYLCEITQKEIESLKENEVSTTFDYNSENGSLGKTECWYIMDAKPGTTIVIGHNAKNKDEVKSMIENGRWTDFIREVPVHKGDFFFIEPGTVHAIKGGTVILETQQSSDITYRVYDYDRLQDGKCFFAIGFPQNLHQNSNKFADGIPGNLHLQIC